jgi:hypothetical protein
MVIVGDASREPPTGPLFARRKLIRGFAPAESQRGILQAHHREHHERRFHDADSPTTRTEVTMKKKKLPGQPVGPKKAKEGYEDRSVPQEDPEKRSWEAVNDTSIGKREEKPRKKPIQVPPAD